MKDLVKLLAASGKLKFTDIKNKLKIDDPTKLSFHLRILKEHFLIEQDSDKIYMLSSNGKNLLENLKKIDGGGVEEVCGPSQKSARRTGMSGKCVFYHSFYLSTIKKELS